MTANVPHLGPTPKIVSSNRDGGLPGSFLMARVFHSISDPSNALIFPGTSLARTSTLPAGRIRHKELTLPFSAAAAQKALIGAWAC